ncbi:MAG TPA: hypothetical protein VGO50_18615 [Pyrinomonadaceae bacterium]|nr:hypothetical protein [Pyrinomonadaceae bacterium]
MAAVKEAIGAQAVPTNYTDINAIPVEQEISCRPMTDLNFIGPNGIFTSVTKDKVSITIRGALLEVISFDLKFNPKHGLNPGGIVPGCNSDDVMVVAAQSSNVQSVAAPVFTRTNNKVTSVKLFFMRLNKTKPVTLGVRVKFEENGGTGLQFIPRRKTEGISFP